MSGDDEIWRVAKFLAQEHGACADALAARIGDFQPRRDGGEEGVAFWAGVEEAIRSLLAGQNAMAD